MFLLAQFFQVVRGFSPLTAGVSTGSSPPSGWVPRWSRPALTALALPRRRGAAIPAPTGRGTAGDPLTPYRSTDSIRT